MFCGLKILTGKGFDKSLNEQYCSIFPCPDNHHGAVKIRNRN
jgi:hypothetical protein